MENQVTPLTFPQKNTESKFSDIRAGHVGIRTNEYSKTIQWYREKLDFRIVRQWTVGDLQLAFLALPDDDDFLIEIFGNNNISQAEKTTDNRLDHFCLQVNDLDTTIKELESRGVAIARTFSIPAIGKRVAFIADLHGNAIEFCEDIK
jgi:lactoylglutathione lyase